MKYQVYFLGVAALLPLVSSAPGGLPVCIIGAGPAGLMAAAKLEVRGKQVVVFEKQAAVGGKCQAVYDGNTYHPLGALLFSNASFPEALKVIATSGVQSTPFVHGTQWHYNITSGVTTLEPAFPVEFTTLLMQEVPRYVTYWNTVFAKYNVLGYKNGVPQELTVTTSDWLASNNYQALPAVFNKAMETYGYGDLREVPILYALSFLTPDILGFFTNQHGVYQIDFHKVLVNFAAKSIKGQINTNSKITKIDRYDSWLKITYQAGGQSKAVIQYCSALILAFPPTVSALQAANLQLSPAEHTVFSPVLLTAYYSGAIHLQTPRNLGFSEKTATPSTPVSAIGEPIAFLYMFNSSDIATTWSWGKTNIINPDIARILLRAVLSKINKDPNNSTAVSKTVTDADIVGFQANDHFPHFAGDQLKGGWYANFNALQGVNSTYYASGLNGFETLEFALKAGIDVVQSYF